MIKLKDLITEKSEFHDLEGWEKNFPGFKEKEYLVIQKVIMMSHDGISGVIKDYKKNKAHWSKWIKNMAAKGMWKLLN